MIEPFLSTLFSSTKIFFLRDLVEFPGYFVPLILIAQFSINLALNLLNYLHEHRLFLLIPYWTLFILQVQKFGCLIFQNNQLFKSENF